MRLAINIDHIATLRNARGGSHPDPVEAARVCERAGAVGIVVHLREDRRHIKDLDVQRLRQSITSKLDLEMAATDEIIRIACETKPELVTLVPERRMELTTEGGLDIVRQKSRMEEVVRAFHDHRIPVSLFVDPVHAQIEASRAIGSDMVELHTGEYADAVGDEARANELKRIREISVFGKSLGLGINAGHGLDYHNIHPIAAIPEIDEVSIGYAVITRAVFVGLENAVREMRQLIDSTSQQTS